jgi:transcription initiation factor IIE alpha subunit
MKVVEKLSLTEFFISVNIFIKVSFSLSGLMRGYCPKCKEYRSDDGRDAWAIIWKDGLAICERC